MLIVNKCSRWEYIFSLTNYTDTRRRSSWVGSLLGGSWGLYLCLMSYVFNLSPYKCLLTESLSWALFCPLGPDLWSALWNLPQNLPQESGLFLITCTLYVCIGSISTGLSVVWFHSSYKLNGYQLTKLIAYKTVHDKE